MSPIEQTTRGSNFDYRGGEEADGATDVVDGSRLSAPAGAVRLRSVNSSTSESTPPGREKPDGTFSTVRS